MHTFAFAAVSLALFGSVAGSDAIHLSTGTPAPAEVAKVAAASHTESTKPAVPPPVMVTVQADDTLSKIADAHGTTYQRLFDANDFIVDPNIIHVGDQIRIPRADETLPDRPLPSTPAPAPAPAAVSTAPAAVSSHTTVSHSYAAPAPLPDDAAKAFIYSHESGNNPGSTSPNGCYGLGQDCNGVVRGLCGTDYACQDQYFTSYMSRRYGSWANAAAFWQANGWW